MSMSLKEAASALVRSVHAPKGAINVLPLNDAHGKHLVVWVDAKCAPIINKIPRTFEGYPVSIEQKPEIFAH